MTNRQRITQNLQGRKTDRPVFGVGLGFYPWGETLQRWRTESGIPDLDVAKYFNYDHDFLELSVEYGPFPHFESKVLSEDSEYVLGVDFRGITTRNRKDGGSMPEFIRHPVNSPEEWQQYKEERLGLFLDERLKSLDQQMDSINQVDAPLQASRYPWGMFGTARDLLGTENLLIDFYTDPDMVYDIMKTLTDLWLALYEKIAEKVQIDHIHIWEDMSGKQGSLISMNMVEEFMMPQYDRIADFARQRQIPLLSVDTDGNVDELIGVFTKHGVNVMFPFEVQAGCDVEKYRDIFPDLGMLGGLDKNALAKTKKEIHTELDKAQRMLAKGRYIPGCDHLIPPNVPWENWKYFVEALRKMITGT